MVEQKQASGLQTARPSSSRAGVVVIGRNEGLRLERCLTSLRSCGVPIVYVDSGSVDNSVALARRFNCEVLELDRRLPFTAARARNAGFERLSQLIEADYVQFIDGDCEIAVDWIQKAIQFLDAHPKIAVVCGRRREKCPHVSIFNRLCDVEWNTPVGEAKGCGGDALIRVEAFLEVGGYQPDLIAAEDTELCVRMRASRWHIWRLDSEMTLHDAAMTRISQWWRRSERTGYAFALGVHLHGSPPERHFVREARRALLWGLFLPALCLLVVLTVRPWGWLLFLLFPLQIARLTIKRREGTLTERFLVATFYVFGRLPEAVGEVRFYLDKIASRRGAIIEYK